MWEEELSQLQVLLVHHHLAAGDVLVHDASCTHHAVIADGHTLQDNHVGAYPAVLAYGYRCCAIALFFDGLGCILVLMVMIVDPHVFAKDRAIPNRYRRTAASDRTVMVEKHVLPNHYLRGNTPPPH